jgi:hypothetical protein
MDEGSKSLPRSNYDTEIELRHRHRTQDGLENNRRKNVYTLIVMNNVRIKLIDALNVHINIVVWYYSTFVF